VHTTAVMDEAKCQAGVLVAVIFETYLSCPTVGLISFFLLLCLFFLSSSSSCLLLYLPRPRSRGTHTRIRNVHSDLPLLSFSKYCARVSLNCASQPVQTDHTRVSFSHQSGLEPFWLDNLDVSSIAPPKHPCALVADPPSSYLKTRPPRTKNSKQNQPNPRAKRAGGNFGPTPIR
jgi:hypothetical protein